MQRARAEEVLRFSLRPVFEPRSSFRELRVRPPRQGEVGQAGQASDGPRAATIEAWLIQRKRLQGLDDVRLSYSSLDGAPKREFGHR